jgi:hypothetical protein
MNNLNETGDYFTNLTNFKNGTLKFDFTPFRTG